MVDIVWKKRKAYTDENPSSPLGRAHYELGISHAPQHSSQELPGHYNIPLFELLVVDPDYLFVSWEIPEDQLNQARESLGELSQRRLQVRLRAVDDGGRIHQSQELYGERGRWFFQHVLAGRWVTGELGFTCGGRFYLLNSAGPVCIPRNFTVEPGAFDELTVVYTTGATGELRISGIKRDADAPWPDKLPPGESYPQSARPGPHPHAPVGTPDETGGLPSSPGPGLPSSPWSGLMYTGECFISQPETDNAQE